MVKRNAFCGNADGKRFLPMFGNFQKRIISWALTCLAAMVVLGSLGGVFVLGAKFLSAFSAV
ncbi:MAG: hypothetical protein IJW12_05805, partial [Opitutales bacterium]|nr:hypothetical protein [Opitutales bacterium]